MNQANLKQVLSVVATAIAAKYMTESARLHDIYEVESAKISKEHEKALDVAYAKVKAAPIAKVVTLEWRDKVNSHYVYNSYSTSMTDWAKATLDDVQKHTDEKVAALRENLGTFGVRLDFGTGSNDNVLFSVPSVTRGGFDAISSEYTRLRLTLMLSDDETALAAVTQFLARIKEL